MPTYQYRCTECGNDLEAVQKFTDPALTECPVCHGSLRKVFNAVGVVFKGSGFYRTDSRPKEGASADSSPAKESKGKESNGKDASGTSEKKSSDAGSTSGSTNGSKTDGAKAPAKAASGSSTGSSSTS
jgi:putative FmdB family regulatory protein